jgi:hypothetical protein
MAQELPSVIGQGMRRTPRKKEQRRMGKPVSVELIRRQVSELHRFEHPEGRDAELAAELGVLNDAVHDAACDLEDEDEPGSFLRSLAAGARKPEGAR